MQSISKSVLQTFLCLGLLVGTVSLARAQEPAPDNTKMNAADQNQGEPTADQQKENPADRSISQQIRQSLRTDKSLSSYAQNVKIITQNGQVTLKGPVRSEAEKEMIQKKATEVAGESHVTNELNVTPQK